MNNIEENVTIIIPARKIDYLLEECIKNIRNLYPKVKIILILDEYEDSKKDFNEVKILKSDNKNMSAKRNMGVYASDTKYTAFIDSDAYPCENWLEEGIKFLECNNDYSAVTGNQILPDNSSLMQKCLRQVRFNHLFCHDEWGKVIDTNASEQDISEFMTSNVIMRRQDYIDLKGMNENIYLAEDNEFSLRLIKNGYKIRFIPKVKVYHHECSFYPFMRKIYSMGYYYSNMFIKGRRVKPLKQTIEQFLPLYGIILFILLIMLFIYIKINPIYLMILPLLILILLISESYKEAKKLKEEKIIFGTVLILFIFCTFIMTYTFSLFLGLINFPSKSVQECYKHY